jgi:hypothetical protein
MGGGDEDGEGGKGESSIIEMINSWLHRNNSEPVFVNVYGAQEAIPRNRYRQSL